MTSRAEHMRWCKKRAMEYLDRTSSRYSKDNAVTSMLSDLGKHPETAKLTKMAFMVMLTVRDHESAVRFVEGFAE